MHVLKATHMVGQVGLEPTTSTLSEWRSKPTELLPDKSEIEERITLFIILNC